MKRLLLLGLALSGVQLQAQILVNGEDVTQKADMFEVWAFVKPFSSKESFFMDYGQEKFRNSNYDTKAQSINDKDGKKFEKGEWLKLVNYINSQGYEIKSERESSIGDAKGRIITFVRKKE